MARYTLVYFQVVSILLQVLSAQTAEVQPEQKDYEFNTMFNNYGIHIITYGIRTTL